MNEAPRTRTHFDCGNCGESCDVARLAHDSVCAECALAVALDNGELAEASALCADFGLDVPEAVALWECDALIAARLEADREALIASASACLDSDADREAHLPAGFAAWGFER